MIVIRIDPVDGKVSDEQVDVLQQAFDAMAQQTNDEILQFMKENPGVSQGCASDVIYLRTRSRHTPELEARLIREHAQGIAINICDWPYHVDQGRPAFE